jgi:hypothetical protein
MFNIVLFGVLMCMLMQNCKKKPIGPQCDTCDSNPVVSSTDVLIGCEGNYGWGNASISLYNPAAKTVSNSIFSSINGIPVGDVLQMMTLINDKLYVVINNSGKIVVLDTADYSLSNTLSGFQSPRYIVGRDDKAYVSDLYAKKVFVVDLNTHTITGHYPINNWSEGMYLDENMLWVTCPDTNYCIRINTLTQLHQDTIVLGKGVNNLVKDKNGKFWTLSTGGFAEEFPQLIRINAMGVVEQRYYFSSMQGSPNNLRIDEKGEFLYFLNSDCYRMSINSGVLPSLPFIAAEQRVLYGLGAHANSLSFTEIYLADAKDYVQPGKVYRYSEDGLLLDEFSVGIIPQSFWFKP